MLSANVERILKQRYYKPGESWDMLVERVVQGVCDEESGEFKDKARFYIGNRIFLPNSPCLVNAGTKSNGLFACFVMGPTEDTLEDGFGTLSDVAKIAKSGGGCGFTGSIMRPKNSPVAGSAHGYSYGPNRYAEMVSYAMDMMTQSGFRKMALMYTLDVNHKDIEEFIDLKQTANESALYNFNQSVFMDDAFILKAINNPRSAEYKLLEKIALRAWNNGEPGILFGDTINSNTPYKFTGQKILATNPCGEQPLPPYGSCNLGSINVAHDYFYERTGQFDYDRLEEVTRFAVRFLDNVGTKNNFPTEKLADWYNNNRPIGLGIMGLADSMLRSEIRYGSPMGELFTGLVMETIFKTSYSASEDLGKERGVPINCQTVGDATGSYRRNITTVSIAPTGSIAFIAECSHGIEPIFSPSYIRIDERGEEYTFVHPLKDEDYFVAAVGHKNSPSWREQIDIVATVQKYCDSGISKTINMDESVTPKEVLESYIYAWKTRCKGITVYRNNSRQIQVLNHKEEEKVEEIKPMRDILTAEDIIDSSCPTGVCKI